VKKRSDWAESLCFKKRTDFQSNFQLLTAETLPHARRRNNYFLAWRNNKPNRNNFQKLLYFQVNVVLSDKILEIVEVAKSNDFYCNKSLSTTEVVDEIYVDDTAVVPAIVFSAETNGRSIPAATSRYKQSNKCLFTRLSCCQS